MLRSVVAWMGKTTKGRPLFGTGSTLPGGQHRTVREADAETSVDAELYKCTSVHAVNLCTGHAGDAECEGSDAFFSTGYSLDHSTIGIQGYQRDC
jgi:hypothetical protein